MKTYNEYLEEGLRIVDEDNVPFENEFENDLVHQEMADLNINHVEELAYEKWLREKEEEEFQDYLAQYYFEYL